MENRPFVTPTAASTPPVSGATGANSEETYQASKLRKYVLYTLIFPPIGFILALRDRILHLVLPHVLVAESVTFGIFAFLTISLVKPTLLLLNLDPGLIFSGWYWLVLLVLLAVFLVLGLAVGIYYKNVLRRDGALPQNGVAVLFGILIIHYLLSSLLFFYLKNNLQTTFESWQSPLQTFEEPRDP